ncbi:MAG: hypothetical protein ACI8QZ_002811, partial [Chlamydiales bacterium]
MHYRTVTILGASLLAACHARSPSSPQDAQATRPNILFIYSDDHATAAIGVYA